MAVSYKTSGNVQFLGVARFQDRAIVASHSYNTTVDLNGVREVIKSDQLSVRPGVHFSFSSGGSAWHLMSGEEERQFSKSNEIWGFEPTSYVGWVYYCLGWWSSQMSKDGSSFSLRRGLTLSVQLMPAWRSFSDR